MMMWATATLASLMLVLVPTAAWSTEDNLQVSSDGLSWHNELTSPLFGQDVRWVPGDVDVRSFFVRNRAPSAATMSIGVDVLDDTDGLFAGKDFIVEVRSNDTPWRRLVRANNSYLLSDHPIAGGAQVGVDVRVSFDPGSQDRSMGRTLRASFNVTLTDALSGALPETPSGDFGDVLPETGSGARAWWVWLGAALMGFGAAIMVRSRRFEQERSHV